MNTFLLLLIGLAIFAVITLMFFALSSCLGDEMRALFEDWDPRILKLLKFCKSVQKWRLCYRPGLESS